MMNRFMIKFNTSDFQITDLTVNHETRIQAIMHNDTDIEIHILGQIKKAVMSRTKDDSECWLVWGEKEFHDILELTPQIKTQIRQFGMTIY